MLSKSVQALVDPTAPRHGIAFPGVAERWRMAFLCAFSAIFLYFDLFRWPLTPLWRWGDQSIFLDHAERMMHGLVLYRDLFQFNMPGTEWLFYILFRCFGVHLIIAPLALMVAGVSSSCLICALSRRVLPGMAALLPSVLYLVLPLHTRLDATHHTFSMTFILLAVNLVAERVSAIRTGIAGTLLGIAGVFTSSRGVLVLFAIALYLLFVVADRRHIVLNVSALFAPFIAITSGVLFYLVHRVGARIVYESLVIFPLKHYGGNRHDNGALAQWYEIKGAFPLSIHSLPLVTIVACAVVPFILLAFIAGPLRKNWAEFRTSANGRTLVLIAFAGTAAALSTANSANSLRLTCAFPFGVIVAFWAIGDRFSELQFRKLLLASVLFGVYWVALDHCRNVRVVHSPRGTVYMFRVTSQTYAWLLQNARPGDYFFGDPDLNFVSGLPNPTPLPWVSNDGYTIPDHVSALVAGLKRNPPSFIDASDDDWHGVPVRPDNSLGPYSAYLQAHYRSAGKFEDGTEFFVRVPENTRDDLALTHHSKIGTLLSNLQSAQNQ